MIVQASRYVLVSGTGLLLDITIAWCLIELVGWNDYAAVALSLGMALLFTYVCHEHWTFRRPESRLSLQRLTAFALAALLVLGTRYVLLALLASVCPQGGLWTLGRLIAAAGLSAFVNFAVSRSFIFAGARPDVARQSTRAPDRPIPLSATELSRSGGFSFTLPMLIPLGSGRPGKWRRKRHARRG
jgi:putative flippase GtrA